MEEIQAELNQAFEELKSLQKETKTLTNEKKSNPSSNIIKDKKSSSWAKSTTSRSVGLPNTIKSSSRASSPEIIPHDKSTAKSFTISKSVKRSIFETSSTDPKADYYDANIDALSSQKRSRSVIISNSERNLTIGGNNPSTEPSNVPIEPTNIKDSPVRVHSFSKAKRTQDPKPDTNYSDLNIDVAEKMIRERSQCAVFPKEKRAIDSDHTNKCQTPQEPLSVNIEVLSNRISSQAGCKIAPPKSTKPRRRVTIDHSDYGNPGPGAYTEAINKFYSISSSTSGKGVKFSSAATADSSRTVQKKKRIFEVQAPGPGAYDVSAADVHIKTKVPGFSNLFRPDSETKNTPQLQKKKYWEEKARDAREEPDEKRESSFDYPRKRTPTVIIRPDEKKGIDFKNRQIIRKIQAERMKEASIGYYDKKYAAVESAPQIPVLMERQMQSAANTKAMLDSAGIITASQRRAVEAAKRDYYLGPQLQVPWEEDRSGMKAAITRTDDSGDESPTEEVLRLIRRRNNAEEVVVPDTTDAYLRSSYTGTLGSRAAIVRMRESANNRRVFDIEVDPDSIHREYLPTQLHHDWGEKNSGDYHGKAVQMDAVSGRETKKVHLKGVIETIPFHEPPRVRPNDYAPGDYNVGRKFGEDARGALVEFDKYVARADMTGPNGERPANEIVFEDGDLFKEEVIIDPINAKEKILKHNEAPKLYVKDRYEKPKTPDEGLNKLGGEWFHGMASEKMGVGVNYEVMMGRDSLEDERLDDDHDQILIGDELILDVKDWKPNKVTNQSSGPAWVDPKKDPRFGKEKKPDYTGDDDAVNINYEYLKPREGLHVLNMQNLPDRWINETDNEIVKNEIYETDKVERKKNILDAIDEDNQILKGEEMQSSKKRSTNFVNMKQQLNRPVNINKTDAPDILYEVKDVNKEREDIGVRNWDLVPGRESKIITKERIQSNVPEANSDDEEVIVSPKKAALSSSKRPISAPAWSLQKGKKLPDPVEPLGHRLHYNIDQKFGDNAQGGGQFSNNNDGLNNLKLHEIAGDEFQEEELELDPNYNLLKPSKGENTAGGVPWSKQSDLKERITERRNDVIREFQDGQPGQVLDLDLPLPINWNSKQNGKFSQLNVDEKRRGASEILKEFGDEDEELELRPIDINKDNKNIHAKWKKESDIRGASQERKLIDADLSDEELILSPHSPKTKQNSITQWNKQSSKIDSALLSPDDELILSPKVPTNMKSGPSWNKQDTNRFNSDKFNQSEEELILSPKKIQKSGSQGKFRSANSLSEVNIPDVDEEELILAPQDPSVNRIKTGPSWKSQDQNLQGVSEVIKSSEELILTPTRPTKIKSLGGKWEKQNDVVEDLEKKSEELIISPKVPTKSTQTAAWSKQSESIANIDQKSLQNEEVILFPSKPSKKSTVPKNSQQKQKNIETKPKDSKQMTPKRVSFESNSKIESTEKRRNNESKSSTGSNRTQSNLQNTLPVTPPKLQTLTPSETAVPYSFNKDSDKEIQLLDTKLRELGI